MIQFREKCPLSVLPGVRIKQVNFRENIPAFCRDKRNCLYKADVRIKQVSIERGSTVLIVQGSDQLLYYFPVVFITDS